jgi:hypothetical protein
MYQLITHPSFAELAETLSQINVVDSIGRPVSGLSKLEMLRELEEGSLDFYSMLRSVSDQKRQAELKEALGQSLLSATATETTPQQPDWYKPIKLGALLTSCESPPAPSSSEGPKIIKVN